MTIPNCHTQFSHGLVCIIHHISSQVKSNLSCRIKSYDSYSGSLWFGRHSIFFNDRLHELYSSFEVRFPDASRTVQNKNEVKSGGTRRYPSSRPTVHGDQAEFVD